MPILGGGTQILPILRGGGGCTQILPILRRMFSEQSLSWAIQTSTVNKLKLISLEGHAIDLGVLWKVTTKYAMKIICHQYTHKLQTMCHLCTQEAQRLSIVFTNKDLTIPTPPGNKWCWVCDYMMVFGYQYCIGQIHQHLLGEPIIGMASSDHVYIKGGVLFKTIYIWKGYLY